MLRYRAISIHESGSTSSSDTESFSDGPSDCHGAEEEDLAREHAQIVDLDICLASQTASFLERVAAWFCMAVILPALAQAIKEYVVSTGMCTDPPLCASVPWVVRFFPAHIVSVAVMILIWNTYQGARRRGWISRWRSRPRRKPLSRLSAIPPSLQSDHSLYEDVDILLGRVSEVAQTRLHAHVGQRQKMQRSLFCQCVATTVIASFLIGLAWVPFFALSSISRRRFEECVKRVHAQGFGEAAFIELMECEIEDAISHNGLKFTDRNMTAGNVAKAEASVWNFSMLGHFFFLPYSIQSFNLFQLAPIEIFGGIFAVGYIVLTTFVRIEMEKLKGRVALAKTQMRDDFRHCSPVSAGRPLQGAGEKAMELPSLLEAYTMVMREVLPSYPRTSASQLACVLLLVSVHLASTSLMRASAVGGRTVTLSSHMRFFALCNHVSVLACSVHFYLNSTHAALVYRRSIPRLQAWRGMWHRRTCVIFRDHVDGLSHGKQKKNIRHSFIFLNLDTMAKVEVWRRMQSWVRFDVLQDRIEAEGLAFVSVLSMMMLFGMRIVFVLANASLRPAPTVWFFLAIDILIFGRPLLYVLATCSEIAKEHRLDLQYLSDLREAALHREGSDLLSHLFATVISQEDHTHEYEKLLSITITPGITSAASAVVASGILEALWKFAQRILIEHLI